MKMVAVVAVVAATLSLCGCQSSKSDDYYNLSACKKIAIELRTDSDPVTTWRNISKIGAATPTEFGTKIVNVENANIDKYHQGTLSLKQPATPDPNGMDATCRALGVILLG